jgi:hypothetical protein
MLVTHSGWFQNLIDFKEYPAKLLSALRDMSHDQIGLRVFKER